MTMWNHLPDGAKYWLLFVCPLLALLLAATGCSTMYPKMLDDPETIQAFQQMVRESNKTWTADGQVYNPEVEFYYKISFGGRIIGVTSKMGATGASGPQAPAPVVDLGEPHVMANTPAMLITEERLL